MQVFESLNESAAVGRSTVIYSRWDGPLGAILMTAEQDCLSGLYFVGQKWAPSVDARWTRVDELPLFEQTRAQLKAYADGSLRRFDLPLQLHGTRFQRRVWDALLQIEFGQTISYSQLACQLNSPAAVRAVGSAVGRNPVSVIVPCHRVLGADGSLTGYAGGLDRKRCLLMHEGALPASLLAESAIAAMASL